MQELAKQFTNIMEFNTFLLEKCWINYGNYYKDREDFHTHYKSGEIRVPVPDIEKLYEEFLNSNPQFPSQFKHGDNVILDFKDAGKISNGEIIKVHFSDRKVLYDVEIKTLAGLGNQYTRIYNIDSVFVIPQSK